MNEDSVFAVCVVAICITILGGCYITNRNTYTDPLAQQLKACAVGAQRDAIEKYWSVNTNCVHIERSNK